MEIIRNPEPAQYLSLCQRATETLQDLSVPVREILNAVRKSGDATLNELTRKYDLVENPILAVSPEALQNARNEISTELAQAIEIARKNIAAFHESQREVPREINTMPGVTCWRKSVPIRRVGLYIPGGTAPLFSSLLMLAIPAQIAGCKEIVVVTPPLSDGSVHPAIRFVAAMLGITKVFAVGGAQAIGALAYGTETIPRVDKIFGPGNQWVTVAKQLVQQEGIAIDLPAGPSEVLVIADKDCSPAFVAADLLSQAEHGPDSQVMLVSDSEAVLFAVEKEIQLQLDQLPRKAVAEIALQSSRAILVKSLAEAVAFSNEYAPEHLILAVENPRELAEQVENAGSIFLGRYACESAGDYASGTNHTLPTNGYATAYSGVSLDSYVKKITLQEITVEGIRNIGPAIEIMAEAEELQAHKNAVTLRLDEIRNL